MAETQKQKELVHKELSYKIVGVLYEVYNELGPGLSERTYQKAVAMGLKIAGLKFEEQLYSPLVYLGEKIARNYFDFLVEDKVVVELKKGIRPARAHIQQPYQYLVSKELKLGILVYFTSNNLIFKRIVNLRQLVKICI